MLRVLLVCLVTVACFVLMRFVHSLGGGKGGLVSGVKSVLRVPYPQRCMYLMK